MPAGRKGKYREWISPDGQLMIEGFARDGLNDDEIAGRMHISRSTLYEWINKYSEISDAIKKGRAPINVKVEKTFFSEKLQSRIIELKTTEKTIHRDPDGKITGSTEHIRVTEQFVPADTTAMIFYLKCRLGNKYNDKIGVEISAAKNGKLADLIDGLKEDSDDLYTETAAADETVADEQPKTT